MAGRGHLSCLSSGPGNEAGACAGSLNQVRQSMVGPVENPVAVCEFLERYRPFALRQRVRSGQDDDELFPSQSNQRAIPVRRARSDRYVTDARSYRVVECLTVGELAQGNPDRRMVRVPQFKGWWQQSEGYRRHGSHFEFSTFESEHAARVALC